MFSRYEEGKLPGKVPEISGASFSVCQKGSAMMLSAVPGCRCFPGLHEASAPAAFAGPSRLKSLRRHPFRHDCVPYPLRIIDNTVNTCEELAFSNISDLRICAFLSLNPSDSGLHCPFRLQLRRVRLPHRCWLRLTLTRCAASCGKE